MAPEMESPPRSKIAGGYDKSSPDRVAAEIRKKVGFGMTMRSVELPFWQACRERPGGPSGYRYAEMTMSAPAKRALEEWNVANWPHCKPLPYCASDFGPDGDVIVDALDDYISSYGHSF